MAFIVGQVARKDDFWDRKIELENIWDAIQGGSHILLVAPRRVGKTSIMYKILDEPKDDYIVLYIDSESDDSENEFWAKLFNTIINEEFVNTLRAKSKHLWEILKNTNIKKISIKGVEFGDGKVMDYKSAFETLIHDFPDDKKIVIMIDEFAQTIENIIKYENEQKAKSLLKAHRYLRQNPEISKKVRFIYAGSIGLESVVAKINAMNHINDLNSIKISPLEYEDAIKFIDKLLSKNNLSIEKQQVEYILEKIEWLIPFYIQLILDEIKKLTRINHIVTNNKVDEAINNALGHRSYFDNWRSKIKEGFDNNSYLFAKEVLNITSENITITSKEIANLASKYKLENDDAKETIHSLVYDGYINNESDMKVYRFNSPILRMWWYKNVAN